MRVTKKWLRIAKFNMRSEIERVMSLSPSDTIDEFEQVFKYYSSGQSDLYRKSQLLIVILERCIPYDIVN